MELDLSAPLVDLSTSAAIATAQFQYQLMEQFLQLMHLDLQFLLPLWQECYLQDPKRRATFIRTSMNFFSAA